MKLRILLLAIPVFFFVASSNTYGQTQKKVVFEFFTSASCGNCPTGIGEIQRLLNEYGEDRIIWISHHAGWLWDPMLFDEINTIANDFASGAPTGMIDRTNNLGSTWLATTPTTWENQIINALAESATVWITFSGNYDDASRTIDFSVAARFESNVDPGDFRLNVMILENNVNEGTSQYNQANYFNNSSGHPFEGAGNPIIGYQHKNVTRAVLDDAWGTENVIPDNPALNTDYSSNYSYTLPENFDETEISIVAFVSYYDNDADNREILNGDVIHIDDLTTATSTNSISYVESFGISPNPATGSTLVTINSTIANSVTMQLMHVNGQRVKTFNSELQTGVNNIPLSLEGLPAGTYLLVISDGIEQVTRKLIVK
ncbi:MAG: Omp28-related outer membrane protein [Bacteroidota bacterium]